MPVMRIFSALPVKEKKQLEDRARKENVSEYKLVQNFVKCGLNVKNRTPLSVYSTTELLQELWRRVP